MNPTYFALGLLLALLLLPEDDAGDVGDERELPTTCRSCDDRTRMRGNFMCPSCHPDTSPEDYDGRMADE